VDANPAFEAFRRQSENNNLFRLGAFAGTGTGSSVENGEKGLASPTSASAMDDKSVLMIKDDRERGAKLPLSPRIITAATGDNIATGESPKRTSPKRMLSADASMFSDRPRRDSPASFLEGIDPSQEAAFISDGRFPRPSLPSNKVSAQLSHHRSETLPGQLDKESSPEGPTLVTAQHVVGLLEAANEEILLLDLRVSTQYAKGRITGALNLCIPTTLLKRPSFNVAKLAETFGKETDARRKFEGWRKSKYIIVYDADSKQLKDATSCINTLKKFANEGWKGLSYIVRGGFAEFASKFPALTSIGVTPVGELPSPSNVSSMNASRNNSVVSNSSIEEGGPAVAPVIGGCPMPSTKNAANPFFGNIRQNMDLIGGVGQISIKRPRALDADDDLLERLPKWLKRAVDERDHGKTVAEKFLGIEKREQRRMQDALRGDVVYAGSASGTGSGVGTSPTSTGASALDQDSLQSQSSKNTSIKLAGIEKGAKNRYNNIWPFEHTRVRLEGIAEGDCDYVNANHVGYKDSAKRYIATQGPIPATFNVSALILADPWSRSE
jgi:tyrosine-protein phosphatase 2/3